MRFLIALALLICTNILNAQTGADTTSYPFSAGTHFILKVVKTKTGLKTSLVKIEKVKKDVDYLNMGTLFCATPIPGTIEGVFGKGAGIDGQYKTALMLRNNTKFKMEYKARILYTGRKGWVETDVYDLLPQTGSNELWQNDLSAIEMRNFRIKP
jgi:hypothetical protein